MAAATMALEPTTKPFGRALGDLLRDNDFTFETGNPNWHAFARELEGFHYETLRKAVAGQRNGPSHELMEEIARVLRIDPSHFVEYRAWQAQQAFDPNVVGMEKVLENLERWASDRTPKRGRR